MTRMTTIGLLVPAFLIGKGGAEKVASLLANYLCTLNFKVIIVCRPAAGKSASYPVSDRVEIHQSPLLHADCGDIHALNLDLIIGFAMMGFSDEIAMIAKKIKVKYVIQECTNPKRMIRLMAEDKNYPFNDINYTYWLRQAIYAHSNGVRLTNPAYKNSITNNTLYKTHAFYNSLVGLEVKRLSQKQKEQKEFFDIVTVGAFKNKNKNGLAALKGFVDATHGNRSNVKMRFHSYGKNNFEQEVKELIKGLPKESVVFHGISSDINEIYADKDLVILPSYEEGMPNVVLEAMTFGIPVIAYDDCAGADDILNASKCGLLISRSDETNMSDAIIKLTDKETAEAFATAGLEYAQAHFSAEHWQKNWLALIEEALKMPNQSTVIPKQYSKKEFQAYSDILEYRILGDY